MYVNSKYIISSQLNRGNENGDVVVCMHIMLKCTISSPSKFFTRKVEMMKYSEIGGVLMFVACKQWSGRGENVRCINLQRIILHFINTFNCAIFSAIQWLDWQALTFCFFLAIFQSYLLEKKNGQKSGQKVKAIQCLNSISESSSERNYMNIKIHDL